MPLNYTETDAHKALGQMISESRESEAAKHILAEAVSAVHHLCDQYDLNFDAVLNDGAGLYHRQRERALGSPERALLHNEFTAIVERDGPWYIAYCAEVPGANGEGKSREECLSNLREAVVLVLEHRREDSLRAMPPEAERELVIYRMKREGLLRHLRRYGCVLRREGKAHSLWENPQTGHAEAVPRHTEVSSVLAKKICRKPTIPDPPNF